MIANAFHNIAQSEASLWDAADQLRANSNLTATEYSMPVLGVIFLHHVTNRYQACAAGQRGRAGGGHHAQQRCCWQKQPVHEPRCEPPNVSRLNDADMQAVPAALARAAVRAREMVERTGTPLVV